MGLMDQLGQAAGGMLGGQGGQNSLLQAVAGLLGKDSSIGGFGRPRSGVSEKRPG